jgi:hypothetical protein
MRLTYTTGARSAELEREFEAALAACGEEPQPLGHLVDGHDVELGSSCVRTRRTVAREQSRTIVR